MACSGHGGRDIFISLDCAGFDGSICLDVESYVLRDNDVTISGSEQMRALTAHRQSGMHYAPWLCRGKCEGKSHLQRSSTRLLKWFGGDDSKGNALKPYFCCRLSTACIWYQYTLWFVSFTNSKGLENRNHAIHI